MYDRLKTVGVFLYILLWAMMSMVGAFIFVWTLFTAFTFILKGLGIL